MQHGIKGFMFQTDNDLFNSKACRDLVTAAAEDTLYQLSLFTGVSGGTNEGPNS